MINAHEDEKNKIGSAKLQTGRIGWESCVRSADNDGSDMAQSAAVVMS
jgi:hypothetical protein